MSFQHQHTAAVGLPGVIIFGFVSVAFIQHYINLHYAGVFYLSNVLCLHNHFSILKIYERDAVQQTKKKNQLSVYPKLQAIVEKLANSENPTAPI